MNALPFFKALSDPTRLKLVLLLRQHNALCVCDLTQILDQPQPTVSRHLTHLKQAGIVRSERRGNWMWYGLNQQLTPWCRQVIEQIELGEADKAILGIIDSAAYIKDSHENEDHHTDNRRISMDPSHSNKASKTSSNPIED